jgi:hypothetical protein
MTFLTLSLFLAFWSSAEAHSLRENPIRRIVNIMQDMQ